MGAKKQQMPCHSEKAPDDDPSKTNDACLQTDHVLSEKSFAIGFPLPTVSIDVPIRNSVILIEVELTVPGSSAVDFRSAVLRI